MRVRELVVRIRAKFEGKGLADAEKATAKVGATSKATAKEAAAAGKAIEGAGKAAARSAADTTRAASAMDRLRSKAGALADKLRATDGSILGVRSSIVGLGGKAVTGAAALGLGTLAGAVAFVGSETARLDGIAKSAQKSGLGFEAYQRLAHVATLSGTGIEALGKASLKLGLNLDDVASGGGKAAAGAIDALGLSVKDLRGKEATDQLALISDAMGKLPNDSERARVAFDLLGKSGTELIPLFNSGGEAVRKMSADVGRVFSREELAKAEAYQDGVANLKKSIASLAGSAAASLAPLMTRIANAIDGWVNSNRGIFDDLVPKIERGLERIYEAVSKRDLIGAFESLTKVIGFVVDNFDILIGLLAAAKTLSAIGGVSAALSSMGVAAGAALGPIGAIAAAVAALIPIALRAGDALGDVISKQHAVATAPRGGGTDLAAGGEVAPELQFQAGKQSEELLAAEAQTRKLVGEGVSGFRLAEARRREAAARIRLRDTQALISERVKESTAKREAADKLAADAAAKVKAEAEAEAEEFGSFDADVERLREAAGLKAGEEATGGKAKRLDAAIAALAAGEKFEKAAGKLEAKRGGGGKAKTKDKADTKGDLLAQLGLREPGAVMETMPAPATVIINTSVVIKLVEGLTINVNGAPASASTQRQIAEQIEGQVVTRLEGVPAIIEDVLKTKAKRLRERELGTPAQGAG